MHRLVIVILGIASTIFNENVGQAHSTAPTMASVHRTSMVTTTNRPPKRYKNTNSHRVDGRLSGKGVREIQRHNSNSKMMMAAHRQNSASGGILYDRTSQDGWDRPVIGAIVIGTFFLIITLSLSIAILIFCRKKNTVFVFQKSEQQEEDEDDDDDDDDDDSYFEQMQMTDSEETSSFGGSCGDVSISSRRRQRKRNKMKRRKSAQQQQQQQQQHHQLEHNKGTVGGMIKSISLDAQDYLFHRNKKSSSNCLSDLELGVVATTNRWQDQHTSRITRPTTVLYPEQYRLPIPSHALFSTNQLVNEFQPSLSQTTNERYTSLTHNDLGKAAAWHARPWHQSHPSTSSFPSKQCAIKTTNRDYTIRIVIDCSDETSYRNVSFDTTRSSSESKTAASFPKQNIPCINETNDRPTTSHSLLDKIDNTMTSRQYSAQISPIDLHNMCSHQECECERKQHLKRPDCRSSEDYVIQDDVRYIELPVDEKTALNHQTIEEISSEDEKENMESIEVDRMISEHRDSSPIPDND